MLNKLVKKYVEILQMLLGRSLHKYNDLEYRNRVDRVGSFIHSTMPQIDPERFHPSLVVIEEGIINLFQLPSGKAPKFNYTIFEQSIFILVADISSTTWDEARLRGVSRSDWEATQDDLSFIEQAIPSLKYLQGGIRPICLIVRWTDPIGEASLLSRLTKAMDARSE